MLHRICLLVLGVVTAACAAHSMVGTERIGPEYITGGGHWNTGGGISAVVRAFPRNGATIVCGAWTTDRQSILTDGLNEDVMQAASVFLADERLVHGLGFMRRVPYAENISGLLAFCVRSDVPWRPGFAEAEPVFRFPRMVFPDYEDSDGGLSVFRNDRVFRQTPRADIAL